jgi:hypothetical protein
MARGVYVSFNSFRPDECKHVLTLGALNDSGGLTVDVRPGTATDTVMATCNFLVRLLAVSEKRDVYIINGNRDGPTLSHLFERSRESLIKTTLARMILNEEHIRALAIAIAIAITPRHELRLVLHCCRLADNDACRNAFVQWLQSDGGPTELDDCHIDSRVIADSLKSNSRLSILRLPSTHSLMSLDPERVYYPNMALILSDLAENRGLTTFDEGEHFIGDENWNILCQSLQRHPTLTRVDLTETGWMRLGERNTVRRAKDQ